MKVPKNLYFEDSDVNDWEKFCEDKFKSKRVLSKIMTEAMAQYIENY